MSTLPVFQNTVNKTNDWLDEIMDLMDWPDRQLAYKALRVVLQTLRDRLKQFNYKEYQCPTIRQRPEKSSTSAHWEIN